MIFAPKKDYALSLELKLEAFDKSLSHRSVIFSFLTSGCSEVENFLISQDTLATLEIAKGLGAKIELNSHTLKITPPQNIHSRITLQCLNSGTSMRLYAGLLSARDGEFSFDGDESLRGRPMQRIREPLELMGANFSSSFAPFVLKGNSNLEGITYYSPIASAQVKSAFILASLQAKTQSCYTEKELSRDHTERFLSFLGAEIAQQGREIRICPLKSPLPHYQIKIPNDPSSAIFFIVACLISQNRELKIRNVLLNPTRIYALEVLKQMGAKIVYEVTQRDFEVVGDIIVSSSDLCGVEVSSCIASLIDEIPALCIAFACAKGKSKVMGAGELRFKESDRIASIVENLKRLGIQVSEFDDGLEIVGGEFKPAKLESYGDHRIAMSFALVGIRSEVEVMGVECAGISFPHYVDLLKNFVEVKESWKFV